MAYWRQKPAKELIHHSDRGSQYAAHEYQQALKIFGMIPSLSRKGDCYDNTGAESFFHTLNNDQSGDQICSTRLEARKAVIDYIDMFYNSHRLHSSLGYIAPNDLEKSFIHKKLLNSVSIFT